MRPVVALKKFNNEIFWAIPLTKRPKKGPYYFAFMFGKKKKSVAILSQFRLVDAKRLKYKIGVIKMADFETLKIKIRQLLA